MLIRLRCKFCGVAKDSGNKHAPHCPVSLGSSHGDGMWEWVEEEGKLTMRIVTTIPPEVQPYAADIARFVEAMVYKLRVHHKKGKWENMTAETALSLLRKEVDELTEAVEGGNMVETMLEAADVANFGLIIASITLEKK